MNDNGALTKRIVKVNFPVDLFFFYAIYFKIAQESARLQQEPVPGIIAAPDENNARYFKVVIDGPSEVNSRLKSSLNLCLVEFLVEPI